MTNQHMMSHWKTMDECHWHSKSQMLVQQHTACLWTTWTKRCVQCRTKCDDWCAEMLHLVQACGHNPTKSIQILLQHCHKAIHPQSLAQCVPSKPDNVFNIWCWCEQWFVWFVWHVHTLGILLLFFVSETVLPRMMLKCFFFVLSALQTKWTQMIVWVMQVKNYFKCAWKTKGDEIDGCRWNLSVIQPQFPSFQRLLVVIDCILEMGHSHFVLSMPTVTVLDPCPLHFICALFSCTPLMTWHLKELWTHQSEQEVDCSCPHQSSCLSTTQIIFASLLCRAMETPATIFFLHLPFAAMIVQHAC